MYPTPELISYIQAQIEARVSREAIVNALRSVGWDSSAIAAAFAQIQSQSVSLPTSYVDEPKISSPSEVSDSTSEAQQVQSSNPYAQPIVPSYGYANAQVDNGNIANNQTQPLIINKYAEPVVKKKKTKLVLLIITGLIVIAGGLGFLYTNQKGIDVMQYVDLTDIKSKIPFLNFLDKKNSDQNAVPMTETQVLFQNAFGRLTRLPVLETQTSAQITLPRSTSTTGGFINQPTVDTTATGAPSLDASTSALPLVPPQDIINLRIVSQRDASGPDHQLHTVVLAESSDAVELDAEMRVMNGITGIMFKRFSLVEALGFDTVLNQWIGVQDAQAEIPGLSALGLPGDVIGKYLEMNSQAFPGASTLVQELIAKDIIHIDETPESKLLDVTHVHVYAFTVAHEKLAGGIFAWLDPNGILTSDMRNKTENVIDAFTDIHGTITVNAETKDIMNLDLEITGLIEKSVPFMITSAMNFRPDPSIIPFDSIEPTTSLSAIIQTLVTETQDLAVPMTTPQTPSAPPSSPLPPSPQPTPAL